MTIAEYEKRMQEIDEDIEFYSFFDTDIALNEIRLLKLKKEELIKSQIPF